MPVFFVDRLHRCILVIPSCVGSQIWSPFFCCLHFRLLVELCGLFTHILEGYFTGNGGVLKWPSRMLRASVWQEEIPLNLILRCTTCEFLLSTLDLSSIPMAIIHNSYQVGVSSGARMMCHCAKWHILKYFFSNYFRCFRRGDVFCYYYQMSGVQCKRGMNLYPVELCITCPNTSDLFIYFILFYFCTSHGQCQSSVSFVLQLILTLGMVCC